GLAVAGLADDLEALTAQQCAGERAEARVVVDYQHRRGHADIVADAGRAVFRASTDGDCGGRSDAQRPRRAESRGMNANAPSSARRAAVRAATALALGAFTAASASAAVSFSAATPTPGFDDPYTLALGDLNQDGDPDVIATSISGNAADVALGRR